MPYPPERATHVKAYALWSGVIMFSLTAGYYLFTILYSQGLITASGSVIGGDFLAFYTGGAFFNQGILEKAYSIKSGLFFPDQEEFQRALISNDLTGYAPFINPPFMAIFYSPLARLPYLYAFFLWQIFNLSLLAYSISVLRQELAFLQRFHTYKILACCFLFYPTLGWFMYAQATPIILVLYTLCFQSLRKGNDFKAGAYLGLLAFKPQLAIALALVLLLKWRWRALLSGLLSLILCLGIGFLYTPDAMLTYIEVSPKLLGFLRAESYPTWGIHSFFGFSVLLLENINPVLANAFTYVISGITIFLLCWLWRNLEWKGDLKRWDLAMALTFIWGILISPHLFYYDLTILLLPAAIILNYPVSSNDYKPISLSLWWLSIIWLVCFLSGFISISQILLYDEYQVSAPILQISTPVIFLWGLSIFCFLRQKKTPTEFKQS
ncbi:glycosyltransferase family 87 protein [Kiloniella majae]|uniref:glycosyltransferase family 87 protein n=1 Tax=Kiloniella majae TaxID=1938558 RepID=UPI000A278D0F|nr:glycosyltransferase family 87 protein [Kiloniella majae]